MTSWEPNCVSPDIFLATMSTNLERLARTTILGRFGGVLKRPEATQGRATLSTENRNPHI